MKTPGETLWSALHHPEVPWSFATAPQQREYDNAAQAVLSSQWIPVAIKPADIEGRFVFTGDAGSYPVICKWGTQAGCRTHYMPIPPLPHPPPEPTPDERERAEFEAVWKDKEQFWISNEKESCWRVWQAARAAKGGAK